MSHHHDQTTGDTTTDDVAPLAFSFDAEHHRDPQQLIELLGGKGCGLAVMTAMGLPVPPGFTLTTEACRRFDEDGWTDELDLAVRAGLAELEHTTGASLGDPERPLLVSVRSGAEVSMPGMMDTVLDVGMTDDVAAGLARTTGDDEFAADTSRRALVSYASVVFSAPPEAISTARRLRDVEEVRTHLAEYGLVVPRDPVQQVIAAVQAVFRSWASPRAEHYRRIQGIDQTLGTAATVQAMVFGNLGPGSGTGVAFTRDPSTGRRGLIGDFLVHAQGEDVVAGDRTTGSLAEMEKRWPDTWAELVRIAAALEREFADMVDIEFTVERGRLWILQARRGKRGAAAAMRIAVDMAEDPDFPLDRRAAVARCRHLLEPGEGDRAARQQMVGRSATVLASGLAASPGRAAGELCVDIDDAVRRHEAGTPVVLVRRETSPADVQGMAASVGLVTTLGGLVSHAAVVARSWGIPAVVGASDLTIADDGIRADGLEVRVGEVVTVDGDGGRLLLGDHGEPAAEPPEAELLRRWAAELPRRLTGRSAGSPGHNGVVETTRVDRWLWAVRLYRTRSDANRACVGGHVEIDGRSVKPATHVSVGDRVRARAGGRERVLEVTRIIDKRVGASVAVECYVDHSPPVPERIRETPQAVREPGAGRPTKRERRQIDRQFGRRG